MVYAVFIHKQYIDPVHQQEKNFDMRSPTVSWKHLLQSKYLVEYGF